MQRMPSVMAHNFSEVPHVSIPRSSFNRSHGLKTTFDAGLLVPIFVDEALPGDTFNLDMAGFGRMATPLFPIMDNMYLQTFFFAVPVRLIWDNWQKFHGEQDNPGDSTDYLVPQVLTPTGGFVEGDIADYMGLPVGVEIEDVNALHFRAYNLIYNEWFRDQNLIDSRPVPKGDGPDSYLDYDLRRRGKRHDYFTSCLPWPQKGDAVSLPLGDTAPVIPTGDAMPNWFVEGQAVGIGTDGVTNQGIFATGHTTTGVSENLAWVDAKLVTDLSGATASTVNQLREAFQVQKIYEKDSRSGTRYTEIIKGHFGVTSPDMRLQRPEYLGGGRTPVNINPIVQSTQTLSDTTPLGTVSAYGTVGFRKHGFTKSFTEHCVLIGLACVYADLTYSQGINRMWTRQTRFDYYYPSLAHLGEQAVLSKEIFADGTLDDQLVFGYQERFAEYRYKPSMITGAFRSSAAASLDAWHLSQDFATRPVLDSVFIEERPPLDRVVAVPTEPDFIFDSYFTLYCVRPMPTYSVPGLIDHF